MFSKRVLSIKDKCHLGVLFPDQSLNPRQHSKPELLFPAALQCQEAHELKECLYALEEQSALHAAYFRSHECV